MFLCKGSMLTSWKRDDISQTRQELGLCISHLCLSDRKKSRRSGVWVRACTMQFMKHVFPRLISPRRPGGRQTGAGWPRHWHVGTAESQWYPSGPFKFTCLLPFTDSSKKKCTIFLICMPFLYKLHWGIFIITTPLLDLTSATICFDKITQRYSFNNRQQDRSEWSLPNTKTQMPFKENF